MTVICVNNYNRKRSGASPFSLLSQGQKFKGFLKMFTLIGDD